MSIAKLRSGFFLFPVLILFGVVVFLGARALAQERPTFRVKVDMVVLSFQVTDSKGHYVNGLKPKDFRILEDGIPQKLNTFAEGDQPPMSVAEDGSMKPVVVAAGATQESESPEA